MGTGADMEIVIESERDKRTYDWLLAQVGDAALRNACLSVAGKRRLYVSNLAKVLNLLRRPYSRSHLGRLLSST